MDLAMLELDTVVQSTRPAASAGDRRIGRLDIGASVDDDLLDDCSRGMQLLRKHVAAAAGPWQKEPSAAGIRAGSASASDSARYSAGTTAALRP